jgi:hypothetical protein
VFHCGSDCYLQDDKCVANCGPSTTSNYVHLCLEEGRETRITIGGENAENADKCGIIKENNCATLEFGYVGFFFSVTLLICVIY